MNWTSFKDKLKDFIIRRHLLAILLLAASVRIVFFIGIQLADDLFYIKYAHDLLAGNCRLPMNHWESRVGLVFPVYVFSKVFGFNEYAFAAFPFACSLINIILIYKISELLFSRRTAIISALLLSVFPLEIYFGTSVYPTVPLAALCGISVYYLLKSQKTNRFSYCFWSGLFLGLAYLVHTTALFLFLFVVPYILIIVKEQTIKRLMFFSVGVLIVIAAEFGTYSVVAHNPLHGIGNVTKSFDLNPSTMDSGNSRNTDAQSSAFLKDRTAQIRRGNNFWIEPFWTLTTQQQFGFFYYLVIPATMYFIIKRKEIEGIGVILLWFIPVILYLFYGTVSPLEYRPLRRWPRYFSMVDFPAIILLSVALDRMIESRKKNTAFVLILFLVTTSLMVMSVDNWRRYAHVQRNASNYMKANDGIYFAKASYWVLAPFVNYDANLLRRYEDGGLEEESVRARAYVIYSDKSRIHENYPIVKVIETPKTVFVRLAARMGLPNIIVEKLWRRETYYIAKVT